MSPLGMLRPTSRARASCACVRSRWRGERHRVAVGVVLREREVEQPPRFVALVALHEVGGHVVGRAERRRERVGAPRREPGDLLEARRTGPRARPRTRRRRCPRRPARPASCVYSPGVSSSWCSPVNFDSFSTTTERAGMLMPSESVSVANTTLSSPARNASSTASFIGGTMPAWCAATPASSPAIHES